MKKFLKFLLIFTVLAIAGIGVYVYTQDKIIIPGTVFSSAINSKFPIAKSYPMGKIKLYNPKSRIENDKLLITFEYLNDALNSQISGTMTLEADLKYEAVDSKLYLDSLKLKSITKDGKDVNIDKHPIIWTALNYSLDQIRKKELMNLAKYERFKAIKDIRIENNKVAVLK